MRLNMGMMNGVHDIGGMHGHGPVQPAENEPVFHEPWEARAFGLQAVAIHGASVFNLDEFRDARERVDPSEYLSSSYFHNWLAAVETLAIEKGLVSEQELRERIEAVSAERDTVTVPNRTDPELTDSTRTRIEEGYPTEYDADPAFEPGDTVVIRQVHPKGHTRCPWYTRGCKAVVETAHGGAPVPAESAAGNEVIEPLYTVRFEASELWGTDTDGDVVHIDMWERYLRPPVTEATR